ncbi:MAG: hypothetical protein AB7F74_29395, partial [Parvibaculaceae bacterium]
PRNCTIIVPHSNIDRGGPFITTPLVVSLSIVSRQLHISTCAPAVAGDLGGILVSPFLAVAKPSVAIASPLHG